MIRPWRAQDQMLSSDFLQLKIFLSQTQKASNGFTGRIVHIEELYPNKAP